MRIAHLIIYVNNLLSNLDFNNWEYIDFENSDLPICPLRKPKELIHSKQIRITHIQQIQQQTIQNK